MTDRTLLIVDDDPTARETLEALLLSEGYKMTFASSGREALEKLQQTSFDLILCDVMMPGMDGFDVCRRIKASDTLRRIPIILVTALDAQEEMVRGLDAGADEFLTKPVNKTTLRARVRVMLRIKTQFDELGARASGTPDLEALLRARVDRLSQEAELSPREREVLDLLLLGRSSDEIGTVLGITARTAKFHQANVLQKLGADSRMDLLRLFL